MKLVGQSNLEMLQLKNHELEVIWQPLLYLEAKLIKSTKQYKFLGGIQLLYEAKLYMQYTQSISIRKPYLLQCYFQIIITRAVAKKMSEFVLSYCRVSS